MTSKLTNNEKASLAFAGLLIVESFMPWVIVTTLLGTTSVTGIEGEGRLLVLLAVLLVLVELTAGTHKTKQRAALIVGLVCLGICAKTLLSTTSLVGVPVNPFFWEAGPVEIQGGLYLAAVTSLMLVIAGVMPDKEAEEQEAQLREEHEENDI